MILGNDSHQSNLVETIKGSESRTRGCCATPASIARANRKNRYSNGQSERLIRWRSRQREERPRVLWSSWTYRAPAPTNRSSPRKIDKKYFSPEEMYFLNEAPLTRKYLWSQKFEIRCLNINRTSFIDREILISNVFMTKSYIKKKKFILTWALNEHFDNNRVDCCWWIFLTILCYLISVSCLISQIKKLIIQWGNLQSTFSNLDENVY